MFFGCQEQYTFVYEALEEFLTCGHSYFSVSVLSQTLKRKSMKGPNGKSEYQIEFEVSNGGFRESNIEFEVSNGGFRESNTEFEMNNGGFMKANIMLEKSKGDLMESIVEF